MNSELNSEFDFYKLKDCIDPYRLYWWKIVKYQYVIPFVEKHIDILSKENLKDLSRNPFAVSMLEKHIDKISWNDFVNNPNAIYLIEKNIDLCFNSLDSYGILGLFRHPDFIHLIKKYNNKIIDKLLVPSSLPIIASQQKPLFMDLLVNFMNKYPEKIPNKNSNNFWNYLCQNPLAIHIIENNLDKLSKYSWQILAKNPNAISIIEKNIDKLEELGWSYLSKNPNAIKILEKNIDKIDWFSLSSNLNGIKILEKYKEKIVNYSFIDYENLNVHNDIFKLDYEAIKNRCLIYKEELIAVALQPWRIESYLAQGIELKELDNYI